MLSIELFELTGKHLLFFPLYLQVLLCVVSSGEEDI